MTHKIFIHSYYSEDSEVRDGLYEVVFHEGFNPEEITQVYEELQDNEEGKLVTELKEVLDVLVKRKRITRYVKWDTLLFDCDYGTIEGSWE